VRRAALAALAAAAALAAGCGSGDPSPDAPAAVADAPAVPVAAPAATTAPARSEPFALVPGAAGDLATGVARPGQAGALELRLANGADRARTFALAADAAWLSLPSAVTVPPRQSVPVQAVVAVPADAPAGVMAARVTARPAEQAGGALAVDYASAVPVRIRVAP
jgi:hypothetical protein